MNFRVEHRPEHRALLLLLFAAVFALPVQAQDTDADTEQTEEPEEIEAAEVDEDEFDETDLDDQGFTDVDDDFRPSEDIPSDQSIPFPTDI